MMKPVYLGINTQETALTCCCSASGSSSRPEPASARRSHWGEEQKPAERRQEGGMWRSSGSHGGQTGTSGLFQSYFCDPPSRTFPHRFHPSIIFIVFPALRLSHCSQRTQKLKQSVIPASASVSIQFCIEKYVGFFFKSSLFPFLSLFF